MTHRIGRLTLIAAALACTVGAAPAGAQEDLFKRNGCLSCHAIDRKLIGPAYKEVAGKYRGQNDAPEVLYRKVKRGGSGVWGPAAMPPNPLVSDADLKAMIKYILSL